MPQQRVITVLDS